MTGIHTPSLRVIAGAAVAGVLLTGVAAYASNVGDDKPAALTPAAAEETHTPHTAGPRADVDPKSVKAALGDTVTISNLKFTTVKVTPGSKVKVANKDRVAHSVSGETFDSGMVPAGGAGSFTAPKVPGVYDIRSIAAPWDTRGFLVVG